MRREYFSARMLQALVRRYLLGCRRGRRRPGAEAVHAVQDLGEAAESAEASAGGVVGAVSPQQGSVEEVGKVGLPSWEISEWDLEAPVLCRGVCPDLYDGADCRRLMELGEREGIVVSMRRYGILGSGEPGLGEEVVQVASRPDELSDLGGCAVVDFVEAGCAQRGGLPSAGGPSADLYAYLGIRTVTHIVSQELRRAGDVFSYRYGFRSRRPPTSRGSPGSPALQYHTVIHAVAPDLRRILPGNTAFSYVAGVQALGQVYCDIFLEFLSLDVQVLRLPPVGRQARGRFAGPFAEGGGLCENVAELTCDALQAAVAALGPAARCRLRSRRVSLCLYRADDQCTFSQYDFLLSEEADERGPHPTEEERPLYIWPPRHGEACDFLEEAESDAEAEERFQRDACDFLEEAKADAEAYECLQRAEADAEASSLAGGAGALAAGMAVAAVAGRAKASKSSRKRRRRGVAAKAARAAAGAAAAAVAAGQRAAAYM